MTLQRRVHGALTAWNTASQAFPYSTAATAGDACFLIADNTVAFNDTLTGWTELATAGTGAGYTKKVFRLNGDYSGTPALPTLTAASAGEGAGFIEHWYDDGGLAVDSSAVLIALDDVLTSTAFSATAGSSMTTAAGDIVLAALALKSQTTMTAAPSAIVLSQAGATLGTQVGNFGTRTITGINPTTSLHVGTYHKPVTTGATGAPSMTATGGTGATNVGGTAAFIRLRAVAANTPPTANAGTDQSVTVSTLVTLNSSASSDPDGTIASRAWTKVSGPTAIGALSSTTATSPTYTPSATGTDVWRVTVTDNLGATAFDDVSIVINAANVPPTANAGTDQTVLTGAVATLNGSGSTDPDGTIATYAWTQTSGTAVTLSSASVANPTFTPATAGVRTFDLVVTDNNGATSAADSVTVTVNLDTGTYLPPTGTGNVVTNSGTSGATLTVNKPSNLANGDLLVIAAYKQFVGATFTAPSGFASAYKAVATGTRGFEVFARPVASASGEPASYSVTSSDSTARWVIVAFRLPGINAAWLDAAPTSDAYSSGSASTVVDPSVTAASSPALALAFNFSNNSTAIYQTFTSSGWTNLVNATVTSGSSTSVLDVEYTNLSTAGATGPTTFAMSPAAASSGGFQLTLKLAGSNALPIANAGTDQTVTAGALVTLNGTASSDPDGTIASYLWSQTAGTAVTLSSTTAASPTFTPATAGTRTFQLQVTDNSGGTATDTVTINVSAASAGTISYVGLGAAGALTTAGLFTYPAGLLAGDLCLGYADSNSSSIPSALGVAGWNEAGPLLNAGGVYARVWWHISDGTESGTTFAYNGVTGGTKGVVLMNAFRSSSGYFELPVDVSGVDTDSSSLVFSATGGSVPTEVGDRIATALAAFAASGTFTGSPTGQTITQAGGTLSTTARNASGSAGGSTVSYGTADASVTAGATGAVSYTANTVGANAAGVVRMLRLRASSTPLNVPPTANAGPDQTVLVGATVTLNGTGSTDSDGTIASYAWTQLSGTSVTLSSSTAASPTFTAGTSGVRVFQLVVTDNLGGVSAADTVSITVNAPPVADAGPDQSGPVGSPITLTGAASADPDGTVASYAWTQISGPVVTLSSTTAVSPTFTPVATGTRVFGLVVTDNLGATSAQDTVTISTVVGDAANAGTDLAVAAFDAVTLTGSGSAVGVWTQVSGATVTLGGSGAVRTFKAVPSNTPGTDEVRVFRYTVGTATDDVQVTTATGTLFYGSLGNFKAAEVTM